jgi:hypothetical protein
MLMLFTPVVVLILTWCLSPDLYNLKHAAKAIILGF